MLEKCVCDETAICVTVRATGQSLYGTYRRHDRQTITIYGMVCGEADGDRMEENTFRLTDVEVKVVGKLLPK